MPKLPQPSGKEMVRLLLAQGFEVLRIRGSHYIMGRAEARTVVPVHADHPLKVGTLRGILRDIELSPVEFVELWRTR